MTDNNLNCSHNHEPSREHVHNDHDEHTPNAGSLAADSFAADAKGKAGFGRIIKAAGYSADGFMAAYKNEAAFRQAFWLNLVLLIVLIFIPLAISMKMILLIASVLSIIVELFNTGLEASIDHTSTQHHPLAKIGKD
ncbi:MAG: diacylglycerol kinase, partial [Psychrobacter sp.]|nr:diacylglycerol kinase [Psychrobacter sp.]